MDEVKITQAILVIAALVLVYVLYRVNHAIRLLNNRVNILSQVVKELRQEVHAGAELDAELMSQDAALRARVERHFSPPR